MSDETKLSELTEKEIQDKYSGWVMDGVFDKDRPIEFREKNTTFDKLRKPRNWPPEQEVTYYAGIEEFRNMPLYALQNIAEDTAEAVIDKRRFKMFSSLYGNNDTPTIVNSPEILCRGEYTRGHVTVLRRAKKRLLEENPRGVNHVLMCNGNYLINMLSTTNATSADYSTLRALCDKKTDVAFGFRWVVVNISDLYCSGAVAYSELDARLSYTTPVSTVGFSHSRGAYVFATRWHDRFEMLGDVSNIYRLI